MIAQLNDQLIRKIISIGHWRGVTSTAIVLWLRFQGPVRLSIFVFILQFNLPVESLLLLAIFQPLLILQTTLVGSSCLWSLQRSPVIQDLPNNRQLFRLFCFSLEQHTKQQEHLSLPQYLQIIGCTLQKRWRTSPPPASVVGLGIVKKCLIPVPVQVESRCVCFFQYQSSPSCRSTRSHTRFFA